MALRGDTVTNVESHPPKAHGMNRQMGEGKGGMERRVSTVQRINRRAISRKAFTFHLYIVTYTAERGNGMEAPWSTGQDTQTKTSWWESPRLFSFKRSNDTRQLLEWPKFD